VAAASDRDEQVALARETDGGPDIRGAGATCHQPGTPIDRAVPDRAGGVVLGVAGTDEVAPKVSRQAGEGSVVGSGGGARLSLEG
jgi:hypothetical protein